MRDNIFWGNNRCRNIYQHGDEISRSLSVVFVLFLGVCVTFVRESFYNILITYFVTVFTLIQKSTTSLFHCRSGDHGVEGGGGVTSVRLSGHHSDLKSEVWPSLC